MNDPVVGSTWQHVKTGNYYEVVGFCQLEREWELAVLYREVNEPGKIPIARAREEFLDGRFIETTPIIRSE